jgi:hypothetical protein
MPQDLFWLSALPECQRGGTIAFVGVNPRNCLLHALLGAKHAAIDYYPPPELTKEDADILEAAPQLAGKGAAETFHADNVAGRAHEAVMIDFTRFRPSYHEAFRALGLATQAGSCVAALFPLGWKRSHHLTHILSASLIRKMFGAQNIKLVLDFTVRDEANGGLARFVLGEVERPREEVGFNVVDYRLSSFTFVPASAEEFSYTGHWGAGGDGALIGKDRSAAFAWQGQAHEVYLLCQSHPWSGIAEFYARGRRTIINLFSQDSFGTPVRVAPFRPQQRDIRLTGTVIGNDPEALGSEMVVNGLLRR